MKATIGFLFFMLFLAGLLLVNLRNVQQRNESTAVSLADLVSVAWRPTHLGDMPLPEDTRIRLQFEANGSLAGHGGCNRFSGSFGLQDDALTIGPLAATRMACGEPVQSYEFSFLDALQSVQRVDARAGRLNLRNAGGDTVIRFISEARQPVAR